MPKQKQLLVAGFQHESNSFSPGLTTYDDFLKTDGWPGLTTGIDLLGDFSKLNIPLAGFIQAARNNYQLKPVCWSSAEPYGPVAKDAFDRIAKLICDSLHEAGELDGIYLDLHGAMVCEHLEDGEGEILRLVRETVGPDLPIAVSLDLHANITPEMVDLSDVITIYRTYPHLDMAKTGGRAFNLLENIINTGTKFHKAYRQIPYLIPLSSQHTGSEPCRSFYEKTESLVTDTIQNVDLATGFPASDIWHNSPAIVAYGTMSTETEEAADNLFNMILKAEPTLVDPLLSPTEAVRRAKMNGRSGRPAIIADVQDNAGAGGSSDTTGLLRSLVKEGAQGAVLSSLWDAEVAALAHASGEGSTITTNLGGKSGVPNDKPFQADYYVECLSDGKAVCEGEMMYGYEINVGPTALLRVLNDNCNVRIVVTTERAQCLDQAFFKVAGIDPVKQTILAVKSTVHYRADFEGFASDIIMAACPGFFPCRLGEIDFKNLRPGVRLGPNGPDNTISHAG